jgi:hypothetical protein
VSLVTPDVCLVQSFARHKCVVPQLPMHRLSARSWVATRRESWEEPVIVNSRDENSNILDCLLVRQGLGNDHGTADRFEG